MMRRNAGEVEPVLRESLHKYLPAYNEGVKDFSYQKRRRQNMLKKENQIMSVDQWQSVLIDKVIKE